MGIRRTTMAVALLSGVAALSPVAADAVDDVIAKHIEAKGGRDAWNAIDSMKIEGTFTSFSIEAPFEMWRQRDDRYRLETTMNGRKMIIGHDGELAWWDNGFLGNGVQPITGPDLITQQREFDFATPLFDVERAGHRVTLVGETEYEGLPAIALDLERADGTKETWYLDPETHLEMARRSPGSDFGTPMEQRTFFDDFREVDGVMIPFFVETQWYTRDRVIEIDGVETNVSPEPTAFALPAPPGMPEILPMGGEWKVAVSARPQPGVPFTESEREAEVAVELGRSILSESYSDAQGAEVRWTLSYDQYQGKYRLTAFDSTTRLMSVHEGDFDESDKLTLTNESTGTSYEVFGFTVLTRFNFSGIGDDGFTLEIEASIDGGENWFVAERNVYSKE